MQFFLKTALIATLFFAGSVLNSICYGQSRPSGQDRVENILQKMTLDEKLTLIEGATDTAADRQYQAGYLQGIPRLGIPSLKLTDGPPGVVTKQNSTGMTATMGLAATFSRDDAYANGEVIARDARALGQDVVLEPFVNIYRDPTWNRAFNTFGEDPLLTGQTGAALIKGIQSKGIMAQVKHFIAYNGANNVIVDDRTLHEIYLPPFADAVDAGVASVMSSYNKVNGYYASNNAHNLIDILRNELGFKGWVDSDWGANHATTFFNSGLDMEMPGGTNFGFLHSYFTKTAMKKALDNGTIREAAINTAVRHVLYEYNRFGLLDGNSKHTVIPRPVDADAKVVLKTGEDAATLLKNEHHILPLDKNQMQSLVLIGPGAGQTIATAGGGEKSAGFASRQIGTYQALMKVEEGNNEAHITYETGIDMAGTPIPASAFSHDGKPGLLQTDTTSKQSSIVPQINYTSRKGNALSVGSSYKWSGQLTVPSTGTYWLNMQNLGATATLSLDGKKLGCSGCGFSSSPRYGAVHPGDDGVLPTTDGLNNKRFRIKLKAGVHDLTIVEKADVSGARVQVRLSWVTPAQSKANIDQAIYAAGSSSTAIVFAWSTGDLSSPLPEDQDSLIEAVAEANPNTIVVLNNSNPLAMPWLDKVRAVLDMWYPGDEGGYATANVLLGKVNPAGRLPFTWPSSIDQGPANQPDTHPERTSMGVDSTGHLCKGSQGGPFTSADCTTTYSEGIFVGYRYYDKYNEKPLYPFGHGLSYTTFRYSNLNVNQDGDGGLNVSFNIMNTGKIDGDEVPQVYLGAPENPPKGVPFAEKALVAYDRVSVPAGKSISVKLNIPKRQLQYWSTTEGWTTAKGARTLYVGSSERKMQLSQSLDVSAHVDD
ncbi:MAG TPA: glycoside hydrolase family 3 C-terminal domain-containing protein [Balneolaceae bacterium]|nr:glycoside hydrolase family 3 C-terminal domain-containing protein [Balneolaceae bacterium]